MEHVKPPKEIIFQRNVSVNWIRFKQRLTLYMEAINMDRKPDKRKIAVLLTVVGPESIDVFNTLSLTDGEPDNVAAVIHKFDQYFTPRINETYERYAFRTHLQHEGETIEQYVIDLKHKAKTCNYWILGKSLIRHHIVLGTLNLKAKEKLLSNDDLDLEKNSIHLPSHRSHETPDTGNDADGASRRTVSASVGAVRRSGKSKTYHGN